METDNQKPKKQSKTKKYDIMLPLKQNLNEPAMTSEEEYNQIGLQTGLQIGLNEPPNLSSPKNKKTTFPAWNKLKNAPLLNFSSPKNKKTTFPTWNKLKNAPLLNFSYKPNLLTRIFANSTSFLTLSLLGGILLASGFFNKYAKNMPSFDEIKNYQPQITSRFYSSDGNFVAEFAKEKRLYTPIELIPSILQQAFLAAEDKDFFFHKGIDYRGIVRAILKNVENIGTNKRPQGASTITQQVAKNFFYSSDVSIDRKLKEAMVSLRIEKILSKKEILTLYLNQIYLGAGAYGVAAAALNYFNKSMQELTLDEIAIIAALPKAPENYNPFRFPKRTKIRRNLVLNAMLKRGYINKKAHAIAKKLPISVNNNRIRADRNISSYFIESARRQIIKEFGEKSLYSSGFTVRLSLDKSIQQQAFQALSNNIIKIDQDMGWRGAGLNDISKNWRKNPNMPIKLYDHPRWHRARVTQVSHLETQIELFNKDSNNIKKGIIELVTSKWAGAKPVLSSKVKHHKPKISSMKQVLKTYDIIYIRETNRVGYYELMQLPEIQGAILVMDPRNGRILAMVGGFSFQTSQFNRSTQAKRQVGSIFKPIVDVAALENGFTASSVFEDAPLSYKVLNSEEPWQPKNYSKKFYGPTTLRKGLERSRNIVTLKIIEYLPMPIVSEYAKKLGAYKNLAPYPAMALGAGESTLINMASAFAVFANGGKKVMPTLIDNIQNKHGVVISNAENFECPDCTTKHTLTKEPQVKDSRQQIINPQTSYIITSILQGVIQNGTAKTLKGLGYPIAGKTGTTNEEKDAWFIGYTPEILIGTYVGFDLPRTMGAGRTGSSVAVPIFKEFATSFFANKQPKIFPVPENIYFSRINPLKGSKTSRNGFLEVYKDNTSASTNLWITKSRSEAIYRDPKQQN